MALNPMGYAKAETHRRVTEKKYGRVKNKLTECDYILCKPRIITTLPTVPWVEEKIFPDKNS